MSAPSERNSEPGPDPLGEKAGTAAWRCRIEGRDSLLYEEQVDGGWRQLSFRSEQLSTTSPHHALMLESAAAWLRDRPPWARTRREQILGRLRIGFGSGVAMDTQTLADQVDADDEGWRILRLALGPGLEDLYYEEDLPDRVHGQRTRRLKLDLGRDADGRPVLRNRDAAFWARYMPDWARSRREQILARIERAGLSPGAR